MRRGRARPLRCRGWLICGACRQRRACAPCSRSLRRAAKSAASHRFPACSGLLWSQCRSQGRCCRGNLGRAGQLLRKASWRSSPSSSRQRLTMSTQLAEVRIGPPDGEHPGGWRRLPRSRPGSPRESSGQADRRVVNEAPQRIGSSLRLSPNAFSPTSNTHNIAARSLGRGMPPWSHGPGSCLSTRRACLADG